MISTFFMVLWLTVNAGALAWRAEEDTADVRDFRQVAKQVARELPD